MSEIVDLILPDDFDKEKALRELDWKYHRLYHNNTSPRLDGGWLRFNNNAENYLAEKKEIENRKTVYDFEFWLNVERLNRDKMVKINKILLVGSENIHFEDRIDFMATQKFKLNEIDLINKQYRLLQEIYYSRLEAKK